VTLAPGDLVDAGHEQLVQALLVEPGCHHPANDAPDGVPVDAHQAAQGRLVHGGGEAPDQVLGVSGEPGAGPGEGHLLGAGALGGTVDPTEIGPNFEAPPAQIEVPPRRGDRAGVVTGIGRVLALRAVPLPASQLDGDHHSGRLEHHGGDRHPGQVHEALQCSGDANGIGLLGSVGVATPNLETIRARHPDTRCERRAHLLRPRSRNGKRETGNGDRCHPC
jgi:hypothetical protein